MNKRISSIEMLRIVSMVLIIAFHYVVNGVLRETLVFSSNRYILDFLAFGGKLGVNCFVLISGYFMCKSKIKLKKIITLISETWIYSIVLLTLFVTILEPANEIGMKTIIKSIFPVSASAYWFVTTFIVLMIISPLINKVLLCLDKETFCSSMIVSIILFSILPIIMKGVVGYSNIVWLIMLYSLAAYIRKYVEKDNINIKKHLLIFLICLIILLFSIYLFDYYGNKMNNQFLLDNSRYFASSNSFLLLIMSIEMFLVSLKGTKTNKIINRISSATFGVYLIHENIILSPYLWKTIFRCKEAYYSNYLIIHAICSISIVFCACIIIELIRQKTIGKVVDKWIDRILLKLKDKNYKLLSDFI